MSEQLRKEFNKNLDFFMKEYDKDTKEFEIDTRLNRELQIFFHNVFESVFEMFTDKYVEKYHADDLMQVLHYLLNQR